jgi:DNA-binding FrmR family transcriptional regulator
MTDHGYHHAGHKDAVLKRLRRIEGQTPGPAADGRGGQVLHRRPDPGVGDDQGASSPSALGLLDEHLDHCVRACIDDRRRRSTRSSPRRASAIARLASAPEPFIPFVERQIDHEHHQHLDRHRHDLRALRRERHRRDHRDRRVSRASTSSSPPVQVTVTSAAPLDAAAVKAAVEEAGYVLA